MIKLLFQPDQKNMPIVLKQIADPDIAVFDRKRHADFRKLGGGNLLEFRNRRGSLAIRDGEYHDKAARQVE